MLGFEKRRQIIPWQNFQEISWTIYISIKEELLYRNFLAV